MKKSEVNEFVEMLISNQVNAVARTAKAITEPLSDTANSYFKQWYSETDDKRYHQYNYDNAPADMPYPRPEFPTYSQWLSEKITYSYNDLAFALSKPNEETREYEVDLEHEYMPYFQFPSIERERYEYLSSVIDRHAQKIAKANDNDNTMLAKMHLDSLTQKFSALLPKQPPAVNDKLITKTEHVTNNSILFEDIQKDLISYLKTSQQASNTYIEKRDSILQDLVEAFRGMSLNQITTFDIEERWAKICRMPKLDVKLAEKYNFIVDIKDKNNDEVKKERRAKRWDYIYNTDEEDLPALETSELYSEGQLKNHRKILKDIFIVAKRKKYIDFNPFVEDDITLSIPRNRSNSRTKLPANKAKAIVDHCFANLEHPYSWAVLLMAYQGMRNEEVTGLHSSQIITDADKDIVYINILKGKTSNSKRKIPVHKALIKAGFMFFVDSRANSNLFDFDSHSLTKHFNYFREEFDIPLRDADGNLLNLYSFRHNVVTALSTVSNELKYVLIGHGTGSVTANYTSIDLEDAQMLINLIEY